MNFKVMYFHNDQAMWFSFLDHNWDRVFNCGYLSVHDCDAGDCPGYFIRIMSPEDYRR